MGDPSTYASLARKEYLEEQGAGKLLDEGENDPNMILTRVLAASEPEGPHAQLLKQIEDQGQMPKPKPPAGKAAVKYSTKSVKK